ncbi:hypothetical protein E2C01_014160 [Portunus trituberculatus]|uniref:Uncharacterized protein n=1 Tax=Portunus trituberculatus TaxID=210409 RepID=A0A5B7DJ52_PORTR|nr:hypothetical protein [Portunus trituberculatus]
MGIEGSRMFGDENQLNPFNTGTHFYLEICPRLDHFIDIRKILWRRVKSPDMVSPVGGRGRGRSGNLELCRQN